MGILKMWYARRKIKQEIEKLTLKNEKMKLKAAIHGVHQAKRSKEVTNFLKIIDDVDQIKEIVGEKGGIMSFFDSPSGQMVVKALIQKLGGGNGELAAENVKHFIQNMTPEQKKKAIVTLTEYMGGAE